MDIDSSFVFVVDYQLALDVAFFFACEVDFDFVFGACVGPNVHEYIVMGVDLILVVWVDGCFGISDGVVKLWSRYTFITVYIFWFWKQPCFMDC